MCELRYSLNLSSRGGLLLLKAGPLRREWALRKIEAESTAVSVGVEPGDASPVISCKAGAILQTPGTTFIHTKGGLGRAKQRQLLPAVLVLCVNPPADVD